MLLLLPLPLIDAASPPLPFLSAMILPLMMPPFRYFAPR